MNDKHHFWVTMVILVGGGFLAHLNPDVREQVMLIVANVAGVWFGGKFINGNGNGTKPAP